MKTHISINSISFGKLFKRYKLKSKRNQEIIKEVQKRSSNGFAINRIARKIEFKESNINSNKQL